MLTEQQLARYLLEHRRRNYSIRFVLRHNASRYALMMLLTLAALAIGACNPRPAGLGTLCMWISGMLMGAMVRDLGWLRRIKQTWPFTCKITDWQKVEELAAPENGTAGADPTD